MKRIGRLLWKHLKLQLKVSPIVVSFLTLIWLPRLLTIQFENNPTTLQIATVFFLVIMFMYLMEKKDILMKDISILLDRL